MIKLRTILWISTMTVAIASCDDYLNTPPKDYMGVDDFYNTAAQCEQSLMGIYGDLREVTNLEYLHMSECRSNNTWVNPDGNGARDWTEIGTFRATDNLATFDDTWNTWYKLIYDANVALAKYPDAEFNDEAVRVQFLNEAHFLRGWAYFELARLFGNIPMVTEPLGTAEVNQIPQSTAQEIINQVVIPDLTAALDLPYADAILDANGTPTNEGRTDKMAATAMLARVYMTLAGYPYNDTSAKAEAKKYLEDVLNYSKANNNKWWAPDIDEWRKQWMPSAEYYNKYSIFAIQYRSGGSGNSSIFYFSPQLPPSYTGRGLFGAQIWVEKSLMYEFDKEYNGHKDGRGEGYSILTGFEAEGNTQAYTNDKEPVTVDGVTTDVYTKTMMYKFMPSKRKIAALGMSINPESGMQDNYDWPVNYPILRLEDMQLLYAELLVEEGRIAEAMGYVNAIRERAMCEPVETNCNAERAMYYIVRERRIELLGEGVQWFDEVRRGTWEQDIKDKFIRYNIPNGTSLDYVIPGRYLYPIPLNQMNITPGLYKQNEGY